MRFAPLILLASLLPLPAMARAFEPTTAYQFRHLEGWTVRVSGNLLADHADVAGDVLDLLRVRLFELNRALPHDALARLRTVTLWVEWDDGEFAGMCFHPSADWLREHGYNPDKAGGIEIGNARHFLNWSADQPAMVLHEFAPAYHHLVLGADNADLRAAYQAAKRGGKYDAVLRAGGKTEKAYAMTNADEFFAELSESYFATNDFFPFVRAELEQFDPKSFAVIRRLWNSPPTVAASARRRPATAPAATR